jgi:hypothetical protein
MENDSTNKSMEHWKELNRRDEMTNDDYHIKVGYVYHAS